MRFKLKGFAIILAAAATALFALGGCNAGERSADIPPHLIAAGDDAPVRPIDSFETEALPDIDGELTDAQYRARVDDLYLTVTAGKKPIFVDDDPVKPVYDAAVELLDRYVLNKWHDGGDGAVNIVHALHDWLVCNVDYDFALYSDYQAGNTDVADSPSFNIDGVLLGRTAVCDGLSRAMSFLCAMEGVDSIRVTGAHSGVPHAWNKVKIDGKWYNVDVTADAANYTADSGGLSKQLSHGYFLLSDETMRSRVGAHSGFDVTEFPAYEDYDYYADKMTDIGGASHMLTLRSQAELNAVFADIGASKRAVGKIEFKLDFAGKSNVNGGDMYAAELAEAYGKAKKPDFVFDTDKAQKPYFQYPNGVYLVLVYK